MTHADGRDADDGGRRSPTCSPHPQVSGFVLTGATSPSGTSSSSSRSTRRSTTVSPARQPRAVRRPARARAAPPAPRRRARSSCCSATSTTSTTVNDRLGHARRRRGADHRRRALDAIVRSGDTAARLGGDEFAVLMIDATQDDGELMADRIRARLAHPSRSPARPCSSGSASASPSPRPGGIDAEEALRNADFAMQWAKGLRQGARRGLQRRTCTPRRWTGSSCGPTCSAVCAAPSSYLHYQPTMCPAGRARSPASRPWSAGSTRRVACCCRPSSSRSPRRPG